jgi:hypothetical protein
MEHEWKIRKDDALGSAMHLQKRGQDEQDFSGLTGLKSKGSLF